MSTVSLQRLFSNVPKTRRAVWRVTTSRGTRNIHKLKDLPYEIKDGLGNFLPPKALEAVHVEYQGGLLQRLNEQIKDSKDRDVDLAQTVLNTAAEKNKTLAFNYSSLALNNSFFLNHLKPPPSSSTDSNQEDHQSEMSVKLLTALRHQYGSIEQFKSSFSAAATGISTSGWVWLVTSRAGDLSIVPTFGPGSLLIRSRKYMANDRVEPLTPPKSHNASDEVASLYQPNASPTTKSGVIRSSPASGIASKQDIRLSNDGYRPRFIHSTNTLKSSDLEVHTKAKIYSPSDPVSTTPSTSRLLNMGETLYPLFCISVYEHNWILAGFGIWGKEAWLKEFWTVLDWAKVSKVYETLTQKPGMER